MEETITRVPALTDAFLARVKIVFDEQVQIEDGPPVDMTTLADDVLSVGYPGPEGSSATSELTRQQGLGNRLQETIELFCVFSSRSGDLAMKDRRDRCLWAVGIVDAALKADRGLGGVVDNCTLGPTMRWGQDQHRDGATCDVMFSIAARVLL